MNKITVTIEPITKDEMPEDWKFTWKRAYRLSGKIDDIAFSFRVTPNYRISTLISELREKGVII